MLTAVLLLSSTTTPYALQFSLNALSCLVQLNPTKKFLLIYDLLENNELLDFPNVECVRLPLNSKSFLFKWRLMKKVASILDEKGATKFLTTTPFPALRTPQFYLRAGSSGNKLPGKLQQMKGVIVNSESAKTEMVRVTGIDATRVLVVYGGGSLKANSLLIGDTSLVRETYTNGKQYFLYKEAAGDDLVYLLKAFSKFKKRQKSEMNLVILKTFPERESSYYTVLDNYRYKNDVVLINHDKNTSLTAASYASIILSSESFVSDALDAMAISLPVLMPHGSPVEEWGEHIAIHYANDNIDDLAEKLMMIYKNEDAWLSHGKAGKEKALLYTWERTSEAIAHMLFHNEHD